MTALRRFGGASQHGQPMRIALYEPDIPQNTGTILRLAACLGIEAHLIEPLGAYDIVDLKLGSQFIRARTTSGLVARPGTMVWAELDPAQLHFFDPATGDALGPGSVN